MFLSNAVELGVIGGGLWLLALLLAVQTGLKGFGRAPPEEVVWKYAVIAFTIAWAIDANFTPLTYPFPNILLWLFAGMAIAPGTHAGPGGCVEVAYLVTGYPLPSHTFIQQEVRGLRRSGSTCTRSRRSGARAEHVLDADREEYEATYYWRPVRPPEHLRAHATALLRRPRGYLRALRRSWSMRGPGLRSKLWHLMLFAPGRGPVASLRCARRRPAHPRALRQLLPATSRWPPPSWAARAGHGA